ncbi:hypothetical protein O7632_01070 [Solwaraspora sp. WMMD406]|uniref:hypothetical protein n=1 Tax=Solwaraspora sp. WMMD406 TaxID=3016095 RepID=UPI002417E45C|nr:hypothetical protein [Solwaraspora sp. WMMD406]MDG4762713.1 hypothetical protein [Solwaraspora sp. WMMD406]
MPETPFSGYSGLSLEQRIRRRRLLPLVGIATLVTLMFIGPACSQLFSSADGRPDATTSGWPAGDGTTDGWPADTTGGDAATPTVFKPSTVDRTSAPPTVTWPATDPQTVALAELGRIRSDDLTWLYPHGQYVAQLASKSVGIVDPQQVAENGSHVFYASDILAEHERLRREHEASAPVALLLSTDYGKRQLYAGQPLWITIAVGDFTSADEVTSWCADRFPYLSAAALDNQCVARKLEPPRD